MKKKILSVLLAVCMVAGLLPGFTLPAMAADDPSADIGVSSLYFRDTGGGTEYSTDNVSWTLYTGTFTITGNSTSNSVTKNTVVVQSGTHNIILSDCSIGAVTPTGSNVSNALSPFDIQGTATVNLTLAGNNKLYSARHEKAGLRVAPDTALEISGTGSLEAYCRKSNAGYGAGIGGNNSESNGSITIRGGTVNAYSFWGAGIGSGKDQVSFGDITISGGTVYALTEHFVNGIGNGTTSSYSSPSDGTVTITGGSVRSSYYSSGYHTAIGGTVQNNSAVGVVLYTLTLPTGNENTSVTSLTTTPALGYAYGTTGMKTDADGKLYVYLPDGKAQASVTTADGTYSCNIADYAATLSPAYTATVTVKKDGSVWKDGTPTIQLSTSSTELTDAVAGTVSGGNYTFGGLVEGTTYYVWEDGTTDTYTGQSVSSSLTTATVDYYIVSFEAENNEANMDIQTVLSGQPAVYGGSTPTKSSTAQYTYAFSGWVSSVGGSTPATLTDITASQTVYASFTATLRSYTITWKSDTSTTIDTTSVAFGNTPTHAEPTKMGYTFNDWSPTITSVTGIATYTANWKANAPTAPTISGTPTSDSITISTVAGNEYYISTSDTSPTTWPTGGADYFKATVAGTKTFSGLNAATQYYIHARVAGTNDAMPSASAYTVQYTLPTTPATGVGYSMNYTTEKITVSTGYEVNTDINFGSGTAVANNATLTAGTTYYVRVAATGGAPASEAVSFAVPMRPTAPSAITAEQTKDSITITTVAGQEYNLDSGAWQTGGSFTSLSPNTPYTVYARVKATGTAFASAEYSISVTTKSAGSVTTPTLTAVTYDPAKHLEDIELTTGWVWSTPSTVPTVANSGYSAVYTPTDTATVDYSGVMGYYAETGKVTRTIPLTVNRATPTAADFTYAPPAVLTYNGSARIATVTANSAGMGTVAVRYFLNGIETAPINAGTYTVKIDIAQGDNYAEASAVTAAAWTFTIAQAAQAPLDITDEPASVTYGDTFTLATTGGSGTGTVTWAVTDGNSATVTPGGYVTITGVGATTVTATKVSDGNYSADVTDTYTFTPAKRQLTVSDPSAPGDWTKTYDGGIAFDTAAITAGSITNKVSGDEVTVSVAGAAYDTAAVGSGNKTLTITYAIDGAASGNYSAPANTVVRTASIAAAVPTIALVPKTTAYTGSSIEIAAATVTGVAAEGDITASYAGTISYTYYTASACADSDKTTVDRSGSAAIGGAPKNAGTYYVKAAIDANGNYAAATSAAVTLAIYQPSSGGGTTTPTGAPVIVDGKTVTIGAESKTGDATTVTVDQSKLGTNIGSATTGSSVVVPVSENGSATASLMVQNIADMAKKGMTLTVQTGSVAYNLNTAAIDMAALAAAFPGAEMSKVPFNVTITNSSVTVEGETLVLSPVAFTVTATNGGKTVSVDTFSAYVDRAIEITAAQAEKITTAVVVNADGSVRHVPTNVVQRNGKWYAIINSRTNSTYALIQNEVTFADTKGKWFEAAVNEMGSRKIIAGRSAAVYDGEAGITRAEFAAILVRALGLPADGTSSFSDVPVSAWYTGAVATAAQYGLVTGKGNSRFDPGAAITRQEAMLMLKRAAALTDFAGASGKLDGFADANSVDTWATDAAKWNVGSGLIQGSAGKLTPTADITRAESAAIILRLLQKAGLVDVRSKA